MSIRKVYWGRSQDGYVLSKGGRFSIEPRFMGCITAQDYALYDDRPPRRFFGFFGTQRAAKAALENMLDTNDTNEGGV